MMDRDEYKVLLGRLVGYELSTTITADIEAYRAYCEKQAWDNAVALTLSSAGREDDEAKIGEIQALCPYGR